ncbi:unnamed protein product, partial [Amoebophrya sp. A25]|eukprot:GSA25T00021274001.1
MSQAVKMVRTFVEIVSDEEEDRGGMLEKTKSLPATAHTEYKQKRTPGTGPLDSESRVAPAPGLSSASSRAAGRSRMEPIAED